MRPFVIVNIAFDLEFGAALHNVLSPIVAGLFAGNAVVVKCSEHVAWSSTYFVGAVKERLTECGWDPDLVQVRRPFTVPSEQI